MSDIVDRLNDSLSAGYSELRKEAAREILQLRKERDALRAAIEMIERMRDVEVALRELVWSNDSKWQADRARSVLEESK